MGHGVDIPDSDEGTKFATEGSSVSDDDSDYVGDEDADQYIIQKRERIAQQTDSVGGSHPEVDGLVMDNSEVALPEVPLAGATSDLIEEASQLQANDALADNGGQCPNLASIAKTAVLQEGTVSVENQAEKNNPSVCSWSEADRPVIADTVFVPPEVPLAGACSDDVERASEA